jgi:hypothetical protein
MQSTQNGDRVALNLSGISKCLNDVIFYLINNKQTIMYRRQTKKRGIQKKTIKIALTLAVSATIILAAKKAISTMRRRKFKRVVAVEDTESVLDRIITINAHGEFNSEQIRVPSGIEVLIPHSKGTDQPYITPNENYTYEEKLYEDQNTIGLEAIQGG